MHKGESCLTGLLMQSRCGHSLYIKQAVLRIQLFLTSRMIVQKTKITRKSIDLNVWESRWSDEKLCEPSHIIVTSLLISLLNRC